MFKLKDQNDRFSKKKKNLNTKKKDSPVLKWGIKINREFFKDKKKKTEKYISEMFNILDIREMQIKITLRICLSQVRRANASKDEGKESTFSTSGGNTNLHSHYGNECGLSAGS